MTTVLTIFSSTAFVQLALTKTAADLITEPVLTNSVRVKLVGGETEVSPAVGAVGNDGSVV